ncbi:allophanate hydrolase [Sphingomonas oleivorans]|uniref:Allophanate hydrolase n=1 Tax=Sphingomonas oleivorans TaxID=1735121 RepID=A0A2T5FYK8_9SPHN|nr:allophanate hydrolase [Sphingomonas oleivorans]PTQ11574.1 allophanate hydrolase [Sphingomonas oleivorans]
MSRAVLIVEQAGALTTVQNGGRRGLLRYGVPASGPMDRAAFAIANAAIGNPPGSAAIEVSPGGLVLRCIEGAVGFALVGGGFSAAIDGRALNGWSAAMLTPGARLTIRAGEWGSWACLALAGALAAPLWLGSRATHAASGLGGGMIVAGARIEIEDAAPRENRLGPIAPFPEEQGAMRLVLGPQDRFFSPETIAALLTGTFRVTPACDRMGYRLKGPALPVAALLDMPSEALPRGAVQVAGHGDPTVLLADHQTTGGYPKIATLISADQDRFAQLRPGDPLTFHAIDADAAVALARKRHTALTRHIEMLAKGPVPLSERLARTNLVGGVVDALHP